MTLSASARYLLEHSGVAPDTATPQEILIARARTIRGMVRRWWLQLDPEHTSGVSVDLMESSLVDLAETLARLPRPRLPASQARALVTRKLVNLHGQAEQVIARRLFDAASQLGVLDSGRVVRFAHPAFHELYLGLAHHRAARWPAELAQEPLFSPKPLEKPWGRAAWARLSFTDPEDLDEVFAEMAGINLHLATWYLYSDAEARERFGEGFAASLLDLAGWDGDPKDPQRLDQMLASLGHYGLEPARLRIDEGESRLPTVSLAVRALGRFGDRHDLERLNALAADPELGRWEIEQLRQAIREAQSLTLEPEILRKYRQEELVEFGKAVLGVLVMIGGALMVAHLKVDHKLLGLSLNKTVAEVGGDALQEGLVHMAREMAETSPNEILRLQRLLREKLAFLPDEIEQRKVQIERLRPQVQNEIRIAIHAIDAREP